ncbi:hypothetical protein CSOJ01_03019 [Colletotrichum sojae]|uniref:Uncharacterized protein n=1 Tax=Colletotrichum sojae TaxID=2175907 RepID=A0A8H6JPC1_9PEZI|nr:hypothetical protein CSOJ01_03019 [Colletotrichum sojae]
MATAGPGLAQAILWLLLLSQAVLSSALTSATEALGCHCESQTSGARILDSSNGSTCYCACGKTTLVPQVYTTIMTVYDPVSTQDSVLTSRPHLSGNLSSIRATASRTTASGGFPSRFSGIPSNVTTSSLHPGNTSATRPHQFPSNWNPTSSLSVPLTSQKNHSATTSGIFWSGSGTASSGRVTSRTAPWNQTRSLKSSKIPSSFPTLATQNSSHVGSLIHSSSLWKDSSSSPTLVTQNSSFDSSQKSSVSSSKSFVASESVLPPSKGSSLPAGVTSRSRQSQTATPVASSTLPIQTSVPPTITSSERLPSRPSATSVSATSAATVIIPPGGTITVKPLVATSVESDGSYKTTSVTWLSIDIPTTIVSDGQAIPTSLPAWRCISTDLCNPMCLVPDEVCQRPPDANPDGYPWPEKPSDPPSPENGSTVPASESSTQTLMLLGDIFGWGSGFGKGTNRPGKGKRKGKGRGGGGNGGGREGEKPDDPEPSLSISSTSASSSSSSCTVTYTVAPHCTQPCVVSHVSDKGTASYTTSCATATCRTTQLCTSVETTTTTTYTTKKPERTAFCQPKSCPACRDGEKSSDDALLRPRVPDGVVRIPEDVITQEILTDPETWPAGSHDWWENVRRAAKFYGPEFHETSLVHMDSSSVYEEFENFPMVGGAGPVWGCLMVVIFSPQGIYTSHMWEIPTFTIPSDQRDIYSRNGEDEKHYFEQNVDQFLQLGTALHPLQKKFVALAPLVAEGGPLHAKDAEFYRAIMFVPIQETGAMEYPEPNRETVRLLSETLKIQKKHITIYGYRRRGDLDDDYRWDLGATPPPEYRMSSPWDGLFSYQYTQKGASGMKELVVRFEKDVIHRDAWCGDGRGAATIAGDGTAPTNTPTASVKPAAAAAAAPTASALMIRHPGTLSRREDSCSSFVFCGVNCPESTCDEFSSPDDARPDGPQARQVLPTKGPTKDEEYLTTDSVIDPKDSVAGENYWYRRMRGVVDDFGPGLGTNMRKITTWSTSTMTWFDLEKDGSDANGRPRFGGAGPVWGCTIVVVASPEGVWTSHIWEVPSHTRGEHQAKVEHFIQFEARHPRPTEEYFKEDFLDFLAKGNHKGNMNQDYHFKPPHRNPGLDYSFQKNGAFNAEEKEWVWVGIITRSLKNMVTPRVHYGEKIERVYNKFLNWGVPKENILVYAYRAQPGSGDYEETKMDPHLGIVSWQYHPNHLEGNHREKKFRIRFEKLILWEKSWCGSGNKVKLPEENPQDSTVSQEPQLNRRDDEIEACKLAVSATQSDSLTTATTYLPRPTQACVVNTECSSVACPVNRLAICHHGFCRCVIQERNNLTTTTEGKTLSRPKPTFTPGTSWLPPLNTSMTTSPSTFTTSSLLTTLSSSHATPSSSSLVASTNSFSTTSSSSTGPITLSPSTMTSLRSAIPSTTVTVTISAWEPEKRPGAACKTRDDCSVLRCADNQFPLCVIPAGGDKLGCYCLDRPREGTPCSADADCDEMTCQMNHCPYCKRNLPIGGPLPGDIPAFSCSCNRRPVAPGTACTVDSHCAGLTCGNPDAVSGFCKDEYCECMETKKSGVDCSSHAECLYIRNSETHPYKACTTDKKCEATTKEPQRRHAKRQVHRG